MTTLMDKMRRDQHFEKAAGELNSTFVFGLVQGS